MLEFKLHAFFFFLYLYSISMQLDYFLETRDHIQSFTPFIWHQKQENRGFIPSRLFLLPSKRF